MLYYKGDFLNKLDLIKAFLGDDVKEDELNDFEIYVHNKLSLFIPSSENSGYLISRNRTFPAYMIVIVFFEQDLGVEPEIEIKSKHYFAEIVSPGIPYETISQGLNRYYCIMIEKEYFDEQYRLYSDDIPRFEGQQFAVCSDILKTLNTFAFEYSKGMNNSDITLNAQVTLMTHWIIRSILGETVDMRSVSSNYSIGRVQQYIEQHFSENITVKDLADIAYMSESNFNRIFRRETAVTPIEYLIETRIAKSKILLRRKDITITVIAERCGFGSSAHFTSCFKKAVHMSPTEYRNRYME